MMRIANAQQQVSRGNPANTGDRAQSARSIRQRRRLHQPLEQRTRRPPAMLPGGPRRPRLQAQRLPRPGDAAARCTAELARIQDRLLDPGLPDTTRAQLDYAARTLATALQAHRALRANMVSVLLG